MRRAMLLLLEIIHIALVLTLLQAPSPAYGIAVTTNLPMETKALVDGSVALLRQGTWVQATGTVCILDTEIYMGPGSRFVFKYWLSTGGFVHSNNTCVNAAGKYLVAYFAPQYLVVALTNDDILIVRTWFDAGSRAVLRLPQVLEIGDTKYVFSGLRNTTSYRRDELGNVYVDVEVMGPLRLTVDYTKYYKVIVKLPNGTYQYWARSGEDVFPGLPRELRQGDGVALRLEQLIIHKGGSIVTLSPWHKLTIDSPITVEPVYARYYLVLARSPMGIVFRGWVREGDLVNIEVPREIFINDTVKLIFVGWDWGGYGTPTISLQVKGPLNITAQYAKAYLVRIKTPSGAMEEWAREGSLLRIIPPQSMAGSIVTQRVPSRALVNGKGYPLANGALEVLIKEPTNVEFIYEDKIDIPLVTLVAIALSSLIGVLAMRLFRGFAAKEAYTIDYV